MEKFIILAAVLFSTISHADQIEDAWLTLENLADIRTIEQQCIDLSDEGVFRPPWFADQVTLDFETMGCCYNDGLTEPKGC